MAGFIYIMSNPSFGDGRIKIGKSDRDPEEYRKYELDTTGVPEPFVVEYYAFVDNHHDAERLIHQEFGHARPNPQREYFKVSVPEAIHTIRSKVKIKFEEVNYKSPQEIESVRRRQEREIESARIAEDKKRRIQAARSFAEQIIDEENKVQLPTVDRESNIWQTSLALVNSRDGYYSYVLGRRFFLPRT